MFSVNIMAVKVMQHCITFWIVTAIVTWKSILLFVPTEGANFQTLLSQTWLEISISFFRIMRIFYFELHLALVSYHYSRSKNDSRLKKNLSKNLRSGAEQNWSIFSIFSFLKNCLTLRDCSIQTT